jgi:GMP synthase (glutamine-hydrolysing)
VLQLLRQADNLVLTELAKSGYLKQFAQTFCVLLPLGFTNENKYSIVIRSVLTSDFMTARTGKLKGELPLIYLQQVAEKLIAQFPVSAVFYDVTPKPPATVEWE